MKPLSNELERSVKQIDDLEHQLAELDSRIVQMNQSQEAMQKRFYELKELQHVLKEAVNFFNEVEARQDDRKMVRDDDNDALLQDLEANDPRSVPTNLGFVAGVILRPKMATFERVLWRALRGNLYLNYAPIDEKIIDPATGETLHKNVFIIFAHGKETLAKIRKICESFGASMYHIDDNATKRSEQAFEVSTRIEDVHNLLFNTHQTRRNVLLQIADEIQPWTFTVRREKAIYHTMNHFNYDTNRKCLIAEGWCPSDSLSDITYALRAASEKSGTMISSVMNEIKTHLQPPTYHRTTKFTAGFQSLIDVYGVASYREVNPGLFTVITFPFIFALMFGDFGHAVLLTAIAYCLCRYEEKLKHLENDSMMGPIFGGRYIILLMGIFSLYTGLVYNDIFSKVIPLFPPMWKLNNGTYEAVPGYVYPFGIDPSWHGTENMITFTNSYKMKQSIILGVIHMMFGISLSLYNHLHFENHVSAIFEFIPQILFLTCIFGYLCILIIYKWIYHVDVSLLNNLVNMVLNYGAPIADKDLLFPNQGGVQMFLVGLAMLCIPVMWLVKPFYLKHEHEKKLKQGYNTVQQGKYLKI
jgi:V-type H+-transporting ATPase subunit a